MIFNMVGGGGGSSTKSTIIVSIETGSTVGIYDSTYTTLIKSASEKTTGEYWFTGLDNGTYYIKATKGSDEDTLAYTISEYGVYRISMAYRVVPEFTYTGTYEIVDDNDQDISGALNTANWKIRFLTSGTLSFSKLYGASDGIDIFLVGGGGGGSGDGGGGGGGYTATHSNINVALNTEYAISIGAAGALSSNSNGGTGGSSSFDAYTVNGGKGGEGGGGKGKGGAGGSGGAAWNNAKGGSNGSSGASTSNFSGGAGQGTTTYEFGLDTSNLYSSGGGTGTGANGAGLRADNSGAGGHGSGSTSAGFSGIVIIRNARSVA